jgi:hypothetical protein
MDITFKMDAGWGVFRAAVDPKRFAAILKRKVGPATRLNGHVVQKKVRSLIRSGSFAKNAALTKAIKHSSKPLVDHGQLYQSISVLVGDWDAAFVGIHRTSPGYNLGLALHEGVTIKVTPAMRGLFMALWQASIGELDPAMLSGRAQALFQRMNQGWKPLKASTSVIRIPARPFMKTAFEDASTRSIVAANWKNAVEAAIKEATQK